MQNIVLVLWLVTISTCLEFVSGCISLGGDTSALFNPLGAGTQDAPVSGSLQEIATLVKNIFGGSSAVKELRTNSRGTLLIVDSTDLNCYLDTDDTNCKWRNGPHNEQNLQWLEASGKSDPIRLQFLMGTIKQPDGKYLSVGSKPREAVETAELISDPIGCQLGNGQLSFRHWITRARTVRRKPLLEVCYRIVGETQLRDCNQVKGPNPGPARIVIQGPIEGPFNLVIRANNFINAPEGGGVAIDDITYAADVDNNCASVLGGSVPGIQQAPAGPRFRVPNQITLDKPKPPVVTTRSTTQSPSIINHESCSKVTCDFTLRDSFCSMTNEDAKRRWEVTTGRLNRANPLTGIRFDPFDSPTGAFALADFPDPRQESRRIDPNMHFVLATPPLNFTEPLYLFFRRYMASTGTQLRVCLGKPDETVTDPRGLDCIWESPPLSSSKISAARQRQWHDEVIRLRQGDFKVYFIASYDDSQNFNAGQIGLSSVRIFEDQRLSKLLC